MMWIFEFRTRCRMIYQKLQLLLDPLLKGAVAYILFSQINSSIGYDTRFSRTSITLLLTLLSAFTPSAVMVFLAIALSLVHIYCVSKFLALFVLCLLLILYCLFLRYTPKYGMVIVAIPLLMPSGLAYGVPLLLGLVGNPLTILPTICGIFIYYLVDIIKEAAARQVNLSLDDILQLYTDVADDILQNKQMLAMMGVFALVITVVYLVRKVSFEYSFEIALAAGMTANILGFLIADLKFDLYIKTGSMILMTLLSGVIVFVIHFFHRVLDYTAVERVQFEDDDYYYYVTAVPKINVTVAKLDVKHINKRLEDDEGDDSAYDDEEEYEDAPRRQHSAPAPRETYYERNQRNDSYRQPSGQADRVVEDEDFEMDADFGGYGQKESLEPYIPLNSRIKNTDGLAPGEYDFALEEEDGYEVEMTLDEEDGRK